MAAVRTWTIVIWTSSHYENIWGVYLGARTHHFLCWNPPPPHKKNHATQRWCLSLNTLGKNMQCKDDIQETGLLLARRPLLPPFLRSHLNVQGSHITHSFHCFHVCAFPDTYTATTLSWCVERFHAVSAVIARVNCSKESLRSCTKTGLNTNWSSPSCFTLTSFTSECIL